MTIMNKETTLSDGAGIPTLDHHIQHRGFGVHTPEWMINVGDKTLSTIDTFDAFVQMFGFNYVMAKYTKGYSGQQLHSGGAAQHSHVEVIIPVGFYMADIEVMMNKGQNIPAITMVRLTNIEDTRKIAQKIVFNNCLVQTVEQRLDQFIFTFRPEIRENTVFKYKQDGSLEGQAVSKFDYTTAMAEQS